MSISSLSPITTTALVATERGLYDARADRMMLPGRNVNSVASDGEAIYALVDGIELHRVENGSPEFIARVTDGRGSVVHVHRGTVWIGGHEAGLWRLDAGSGAITPVSSFDEAPTRSAWSTPWGGPPAVFSFASHGDDLYVSIHVGGIIRTSDDGRTWHATIDLHDDVHQVATSDDGRLWAATGRRGLAESSDRGETWTYHRSGLHSSYLLAVTATDDAVLVGASSGPSASDGAVYRFDGTTFDRFGHPLLTDLQGAVGPRQLSALGDIVAVVTPDDTLVVSTDGGRDWHRRGNELSGVRQVLLN